MIINNYGIQNSYNIEIVPSSSTTSQTWMFPDVPYLRTKPVTGLILSTTLYGVNTGLTNLGNDIYQNTSILTNSAFLTLTDDTGKQFIQQMPLVSLIINSEMAVASAVSTNNYSYKFNTDGIKYFQPRIIVWTKCFIYFPVALGVASYCCQFTALYNQK